VVGTFDDRVRLQGSHIIDLAAENEPVCIGACRIEIESRVASNVVLSFSMRRPLNYNGRSPGVLDTSASDGVGLRMTRSPWRSCSRTPGSRCRRSRRVSQCIDAGAPRGAAGEGGENADAEARRDRPLSLREELEAGFRGLVICGATAARRVT
jgi:hypothetical protein